MASIFVCGDIIHHVDKDSFIGEQLSKTIQEADFSIGNLEGVELYDEAKRHGPVQLPGTIEYLHNVGFDMMLLANNHITDQGLNLYQDTVAKLKKYHLSYIGAGTSWEEVYDFRHIERIDDINFGFVNVCEAQVGHFTEQKQSFGYAWMGTPSLMDGIKSIAKKTDFVIVFVHAGLEHYNIPLPEIRSFYQQLCDAGASCVIGGHPHCVQGYEVYKNSFIAYSLGNFYYPHPSGEYPEENNAFSLMLNFEKGQPVKVRTIHHCLENSVVEEVSPEQSSINESGLCEILGSHYEEEAEKMCIKAYDSICRRLLEEALCGEKEEQTFVEQLKNILHRTVFRKRYITATKKYRDALLLRLFENESYRYTIIRAIKAKQK